MKTKIDYNSSVNQDIKSKFVQREVFACVSILVEYVLSREDQEAPFTYDDIENMYIYPEWSKTVLDKDLYFTGGTDNDKKEFESEFDLLIEESESLFENDEISEATHERNLEIIAEAQQEVEDIETESQDIFEWWIVSSWLGEKLQENGEPVMNDGMNWYWGRTTTGQAILLDYCISKICEEMEILEGQQYAWQ